MQLAIVADEHGFARCNVAHETEADAFQGHRFARHHVFDPVLALVHAQAQRTDAVGVAEGQHAVAGDLGDDRVGAAHALVHDADRLEQGLGVERITVGRDLDLVRQHIQQHFRVGIRVDVAAVVAEQRVLQLGLVRQVAVVGQGDAERCVHVERLRFFLARRTGGRVAAVTDAGVPLQRTHVTGAEHVTHQAVGLVHREHAAVIGCNARRILAAVLQQQQCVVQELVDGSLRDDADDATHGVLLRTECSYRKIKTEHAAPGQREGKA